MAYFIPSVIQKRLLRYALTRLDLLDPDVLDLDKLDIAFGRRIVIDLQDVALQVQRIAALLQLPPSFDLKNAKLARLKIIIPADIHSSGIVVEGQGVQIDIALRDEASATSQGHGRTRSTTARTHGRQGTPSSHGRPQPREQTLGDGDGEKRARIPSPAGLARSFLEQEPEDEKQELQMAIESQSRVLGASMTSSVTSESEQGEGTAMPLTLPGFLTNFLEGIVNRMVVQISDVNLQLEVTLPQSMLETAPLAGNSRTTGSIRLHLDSLKMKSLTREGIVQAAGLDSPALDTQETSSPSASRCLTLSVLEVYLIGLPDLFTATTFPSAASSPKTASRMASPLIPRTSTQSQSFRNDDSTNLRGSNDGGSVDNNAVSQSIDMPFRESSMPLFHASVPSSPEFARASVTTADSERFADASPVASALFQSEGPEATLAQSALSQVEESQSFHDSEPGHSALSAAESEQRQPQHQDDSVVETTETSHYGLGLDTSRTSTSPHVDPESHDPEDFWLAEDQADDEGSPPEPKTLIHPDAPSLGHPFRDELSSSGVEERPAAASHHSLLAPPEDLHASSDSDTPPAELSESRLFSREEASSMYMSALTQVASKVDALGTVPGGWSSDEEPAEQGSLRGGGNMKSKLVTNDLAASRHVQDVEPTHLAPSVADKPSTPIDSKESNLESKTSSESLATMADMVAKRILYINQISVDVDTKDLATVSDKKSTVVPLAQSQADIPGGTFSMYAESRSRRSFVQETRPSRPIQPATESSPTQKQMVQTVAVNIESTICTFDFQVVQIMSHMFQRVKSASQMKEQQSDKKKPSKPPSQPMKLDLSLQKTSFQFVSHLDYVSLSKPKNTASSQLPSTEPKQPDVLFGLRISDITSSLLIQEATTRLDLEIKALAFGYGDGEILTIGHNENMHASIRDIEKLDGKALRLQLDASQTQTQIDLVTLPIVVVLDLQKFDDSLALFGGYSGFIDISSSMLSSDAGSGSKSRSKPRRGVRFDDASTEIEPKEPPKSMRVNARIGGLKLSLEGKLCTALLQSSAIKMIYRSSGNVAGLSIDGIKISGPHLIGDGHLSPATIDVSGFRGEFAVAPSDSDLDRLLSLVNPSRDKYEDDDDILLDTLLRQRRKGSVLRVSISKVLVDIPDLGMGEVLQAFGNEIAKLSSVTKYLPDDDRPGILTLLKLEETHIKCMTNEHFGLVKADARSIQAAHVGMPSLLALEVGCIDVSRKDKEIMLHEVLQSSPSEHLPMIMLRFIGEEIEPTIKIKLFNICAEYRVSTLLDILGSPSHVDQQQVINDLATSIATLTGPPSAGISRQSSAGLEGMSKSSQPLKIEVQMRDSGIGLNPRKLTSKALFCLTDARLSLTLPENKNLDAKAEIRKASLLVIDDVQRLKVLEPAPTTRQIKFASVGTGQISELCQQGFISVAQISAAQAVVKVIEDPKSSQSKIDVELQDDLLLLETCADSTETLVATLGDLAPPSAPNTSLKYRTRVMPMEKMMESFTGDAFGGTEHALGNMSADRSIRDTIEEEDSANEFDMVGSFYAADVEEERSEADEIDKDEEELMQSMLAAESNLNLEESLSSEPHASSIVSRLSSGKQSKVSTESAPLAIDDQFFGAQPDLPGTARKWNSRSNQVGFKNEYMIPGSPLKVRLRDMHIIWNLYDGYDWPSTRDAITKAVREVESKAEQRRLQRPSSARAWDNDDEESVIGDFLFNSIYIGIPAKTDPRELARQINREVNDATSETESATQTAVSTNTSRTDATRVRKPRLKLERSRQHKITFELKGVSADVVVFPPESGETQSSVIVKVKDLEIFDHVPTSTWKKFATYMHEAGERPLQVPMVYIELFNVRPVPDLAATEAVIKVTVQPLRLHVDQDALDFITRFFEFKSESPSGTKGASPAPPPQQPSSDFFIQRLEINTVPITLDYKPKRVSLAGIRSGHTTEFMNFFILDRAALSLRHVIVYGIASPDRLHKTLNDIWMPDVRRNQLPGILAGLAPVRGIVDVGKGIRELVVVPVREYHRDGHVVRAVRKGMGAFAWATTREVARLGARIAIGTQNVLQGAEQYLAPDQPSGSSPGRRISGDFDDDFSPHLASDNDDDDDVNKKPVSSYANQPVGVMQGLRGAARSLERDLLTARDAIIAVPGEVMESGTATEAAMAVARRAPTIILRPAVGVTRALGQTLMGAGNAMDPDSRRRIDDKYKRH